MANQECARCHRLFEKVAFEVVCPTCFVIEEEEFKRIKEYLTLHPGASSNDVMRYTGVTLKTIKRYLREDRLEIVGDNKGFIRCEICGKPINSGYFCGGCYKEGMARKHKDRGQGTKTDSVVLKDDDAPSKSDIRYRNYSTKNKRI